LTHRSGKNINAIGSLVISLFLVATGLVQYSLNNIHVTWLQQRTRGGEILYSRSVDGGDIFSESDAMSGIDGQTAHCDTSYNDRFPELKGNYILANPPFNLSDWRRDYAGDG
jgi:hypothetical protein